MKIERLIILATVLCTLSLMPLGSAIANDEVEEAGERCIDTRRISRTHVADNQTLIFYMRGGAIYKNTLRNKCQALVHEKRFSYRTTMSRLCRIDTITVIRSFGGGITDGPSCGLGMFYPITADEAKALVAGPDAEIEPEPIDPADMEVPEIAPIGEETEE